MRMEADFLNITEHEECILNLPIFNKLLEILILQHELVNGFLLLGKRHPDDQISLDWQL